MFRAATAAQQQERDAFRLALKTAQSEGVEIVARDLHTFPIPDWLNTLLVVTQVSVALAVLHAASRAQSVPGLLLAAVGFAFVMQVGFCLVHEAVHRKLHSDRRVNAALAIIAFTLFPASYHFFEIAHLVHHRRNRSDAELEDYVLPSERAFLKRACYYLLICGLFWLLVPLSSIGIALFPGRFRLPAPDEDAGAFRRFAQFLNEIRPWRVRRDLAVAAVVWLAAGSLLELRWSALAVCYGAFAFSWASQQYIYHVRTPRHAVLGALDLALARPLELLYLHFNYHLTHHLAVWVPWIYLPRVAPDRPTLGYASTYLRLWTPPQSIDEAWPPQFQTSGPLPQRSDAV